MPAKKKPAKDYPPSYFKVLEFFADGRKLVEVKMPYKEAASRRHHFYSFFRALAEGYREDPYVKRMSDIANTLVISLYPTTARGNEEVTLTFAINVMEEAFPSLTREEPIKVADEPGYDPADIEKLITESEIGEE